MNKRIVVHDYAGHPFQVQLSRALAERGHDVLHLYSGSFSTPHGQLTKLPGDAEGFEVEPIKLQQEVQKSNLLQRRKTDFAHGRLAVERIKNFKADVVLSANTPLDAQKQIQAYCRTSNTRFVFWVQDLIGIAAKRILNAKIPIVGGIIGAHYETLERKLLSNSDAVVLISEDFRAFIPADCRNVTVIENWAPLQDMPQRDKVNDWSKSKGLDKTLNFLYSGTLGMKHNPELLVQVAIRFKDRKDVRVVVCSQGESIEWLRTRAKELSLDNLILDGFQPFEVLPDMLGSADVLIAILEPDAGVFSVPSKVLSYLCAGRALLLGIPPENLAAKIVSKANAGIVVSPTDEHGFVEGAAKLIDNDTERAEMGRRARQYASTTFDIASIAPMFDDVLVGKLCANEAKDSV